MIGRKYLNGAVLKPLPKHFLVCSLAHRWGTDPFCAVGTPEIIFGEEKILRAGFTHGKDAVFTGIRQLIHLSGYVHMNEVEG